MKKDSTENGNIKSKKKSSPLLIILIIVAACVFCFAGYKLITILITYNQSADVYDDIRKVGQDGDSNSYDKPDPNREDYESEEQLLADGTKFEYEDEYDEGMIYDYNALYAINSDIIGYIKGRGGGLVVDYPIVQCEDNDFYMDHMFDRTENRAGAIFMDCIATRRFNSFYCIIYGHNMRSGSRMFGYLKQYEDEKYFNEHQEYDIYTPYSHYVYKVVAVCLTDIYSTIYTAPVLYKSMSMSPESRVAGMKEVAEYAISKAKYQTGYDVNEINERSHLIALSTCHAVDLEDPSRYVVLLARDRIVIPRHSNKQETTSETTSETSSETIAETTN